MRRIAFFVEGQTEQIFIEKLLLEIANKKNILVDKQKATIGQRGKRTFVQIGVKSRDTGQEYYALIYDCGGETNVNSDIRDRYESLSRAGYNSIVGIRDVAPNHSYSDVERLKQTMKKFLKTKPVETFVVLAIMEIEAWFLAEHTHFGRIDPILTLEKIRSDLGFDPSVDDVESRPKPANDLSAIYKLAGKSYGKRRAKVERTVNELDYAYVYLDLPSRVKALGELVQIINDFLV